MMKQHLPGEAEVAAVTHAIEMGMLRPIREIPSRPSKSTLLHKLVEALINLLIDLLKLPVERWREVIIVGSEDPTGPQDTRNLGQRRGRFHPMKRLGSSDDISTLIGQASLMSNSLLILDMCCVGMVLDFAYSLGTHIGIGFDPNHQLGPFTPDRGGQSGPAAHIYHQGGMRHTNQLRQQIEQSRWRCRACPIIAEGFASPNVTGFCHAGSSLLFLVVNTLPSNHIPVHFFHGPSLSGIGSSRFAFVVGLEPQDPTMRFEGARSSTARTFNKVCGTRQKTLKIDGNDPGKRAFGCFDCLHLFSHRPYRFRRVLLFASLDRFPLRLCPIGTRLFCSVWSRDGSVWSCSINEPKCIAAQHEQFGGFL